MSPSFDLSSSLNMVIVSVNSSNFLIISLFRLFLIAFLIISFILVNTEPAFKAVINCQTNFISAILSDDKFCF